MIQKIKIDDFIKLAEQYPILDVRSPGEYSHAHIPGAHNLPLFTDEERKVVGTIYKQEGREQAIKAGLDYFGVKMKKIVEEVEGILSKQKPNHAYRQAGSQFPTPNSSKTVLVHCWRGGMRSAGVAWLLDLYGFKVFTLVGGYKSFRNWVLSQFEKPYSFNVVGGYTGSGKTPILKELALKGHNIIDLEGIACHKGSAFGALGEDKQPGQEMFENKLGLALYNVAGILQGKEPLWIEDESRRIGTVNIPGALWETIRRSPLYFLEVPFEDRLNHITEEYGRFKKEELVNAVMRIQKRLGGLDTKNAINYLLEENNKEAFRILLHYYDKYYKRDLSYREINKQLMFTIACGRVDAKENSAILTNKKLLTDGVTNNGN